MITALTEVISLYREMVRTGLRRAKPIGQSKKRTLAKIDQWDKLLTALTEKK